MTQSEQADAVIRDHVAYSMGAAMIPIPIGDVLAITALQVDLAASLAGIYEQPFSSALGKTLISSLTGTTVARIGASAVKAVPGVGSLVGGVAQVGLAGASTYAIGHLFKSHFAAGGTMDTFNPDKARELYKTYIEKGRDVVDRIHREDERPETVAEAAETLERLARMRDSGDLTSDEFEELKGKLLQGV
jgi:uncharacterized protein (DUF697 family)